MDVRVQLNKALLPFLSELKPAVDGFELILENYLSDRDRWNEAVGSAPVSLHSVSLFPNSESVTMLRHHLKSLGSELFSRADLFSLHLAKGTLGGVETDRLIPISYSAKELRTAKESVSAFQDLLGRTILIENISEYYRHPDTHMSVSDFLSELCSSTGALLLLDLENMLINLHNDAGTPFAWEQLVEQGFVREVHLAGHQNSGTNLIDSHDDDISPEILSISREISQLSQKEVTYVLERDANINGPHTVLHEVARIRVGLART